MADTRQDGRLISVMMMVAIWALSGLWIHTVNKKDATIRSLRQQLSQQVLNKSAGDAGARNSGECEVKR